MLERRVNIIVSLIRLLKLNKQYEREREREREEREKEQYFKIGINSYTSTLLQIHVDICYEFIE